MRDWWATRSTATKVGIVILGVVVVGAAFADPDDDATDPTTTTLSAVAEPDSEGSNTTEPVMTVDVEHAATSTTMTTAPITTAAPSITTTTSIPTTTTVDPMAALSFDTVEISGNGDDVVDLIVPGDLPAVLAITHSGNSNFAVVSHTTGAERIDLLINTIGSYSGSRPVNLYDGEVLGFLEITADGSWAVKAIPVTDIPTFETSASGTGDTVLLVTGAGGRLTLTHNGESNFAVLSHGSSRDLLVNEIGAYNGTVLLDSDSRIIEINADGDWTLESG